ncbi:MAG TPA: thrombospondin type 3 repeat-containing protein, partial [Kofleriaceae bacterium]|nr:thrombospondin type 3 repeat-containing protein [Kofleriaceae bacterium]
QLTRRRLEGDGVFAAGLVGQVTLPTATRDQFTGLEDPSGRLLLLGSLLPGAVERRVTLTMNLGAVIRAPATYANLEQKSGIAWGLGLQVRTLDALWLAAEVYGDTVLSGRTARADAMTHSSVLSPIEWLGGLRWKPDRRFTVGLAAGSGIGSGAGAPSFRGVFSLTLTPGAPVLRPIRTPRPIIDNDGDGIADRKDRCVNEAEDRNGIADGDGCPDGDADRDGIVDVRDKCPQKAEDRDGFEDGDGCPELDNDGDGLADAQDRCPLKAETINGIQDDDGCPDEGGDAAAIAAVDPGQSPEQAAEATFKRGRELMAEKKYFAACTAFEQSQRLDPRAGTQYNLALCYGEIGKLASALNLHRELVRYDKNAERRQKSDELTIQLAVRAPKIKLGLVGTPAGVSVFMNGTNVNALIGIESPVDFGTYTIVAGAPGYRSWRKTVEVKREGDLVIVDIDLGPPVKP